MFLHDYIKVGSRVERADNPRHAGRVVAIHCDTAARDPALIAGSTFRVLWDNGWREDCKRDEIKREET